MGTEDTRPLSRTQSIGQKKCRCLLLPESSLLESNRPLLGKRKNKGQEHAHEKRGNSQHGKQRCP
jgi:hypothetical protein